ncbi:MAG: hypothetical protein JOY92_01975 [Verrucomicrobia bacterium]|nr:hypothetical protein [Verrucomicrobiota bacterium]
MQTKRPATGVSGGVSGIVAAVLLYYAASHASSPAASLLADAGPSLRDDPQYREELGVNAFTAPSIADIFRDLDLLKPIPMAKVERTPKPLDSDDRTRYALSFGVLIADGFLDVVRQDGSGVDLLGRELLRRAKGLGVAQRVSRHCQRLLEAAKQGAWEQLRKELILTQQDVENAMLDLRDEQVAHLLSLGGWIRGLEIAAACVTETYSAERARLLKRLDLLDYFLERLQDLSPRLRKRPLITSLTQRLQQIRPLLARDGLLSSADAKTLYVEAKGAVDEIEGQTATGQAVRGDRER